ncbi:MAG: AAA family ATPase [Thermus sp.]
MLVRLERERFRRDRFAIWEGRILGGGEVSLLGEDLEPGPEGLIWVEGELAHHPRYGRRLLVRTSRPVSLEEMGTSFSGLPLKTALELLLEAGHTAPPLPLLQSASGLEGEAFFRALEALGEEVVVRRGRVGFAHLFRQEEALLTTVQRLLAQPGLPLLPPSGHGLLEEQAGIFPLVGRSGLALLTGGPGTGKSYTVGRLLASPSLANLSVGLAAPTGKAARRLAEVAGKGAETVHRLLGVKEDGFRHGPSNPLPYRLLVVDEAGMLDLSLALALFSAVGPSAGLLLVGDPHQLPPVGYGNPFADLVGRVPTLALRRVMRQAAGNPILAAARAFLEGEPPREDPRDPRFRLRLVPERELGREVLRLAQDADVILTPTNRGELGVVGLNRLLKARRNPSQEGVSVGLRLRVGVGDPVVFTQNDYALGVANGELGRVLALEGEELVVEAGGDLVRVPRDRWHYLLPAYAMTVHRSQGSEWPRVLVVLPSRAGGLLSRELVYTALTRGKEEVILLASPKALEEARGRRAGGRFTWLQVLP